MDEVTIPNNLWRERTRDLVHYPKVTLKSNVDEALAVIPRRH